MQYIHINFVYDKELKGDILGYLLCLLANQLKLQLWPFGYKRACASITSEQTDHQQLSLRCFILHVLRKWHSQGVWPNRQHNLESYATNL